MSWNSGAERVLGWRGGSGGPEQFAIVFTPEDRERGEPQRELDTARSRRPRARRTVASSEGSEAVLRQRRAVRASRRLRRTFFAFTKVMQDITHRKEQEDQLRRSGEQSMLVREIHHRVKNNLQMIVSLLSLSRAIQTIRTCSRHSEKPRAAFGPWRTSMSSYMLPTTSRPLRSEHTWMRLLVNSSLFVQGTRSVPTSYCN